MSAWAYSIDPQSSIPDPNREGGGTATETLPDIEKKDKTGYAPMYHVILHNDDTHSYEYVIRMLGQLFGMSVEKAFKHAEEVDKTGVTILDTTTLERAELKRDQIRAFGPDPHLAESKGSMSATIEPADK